MSQRIDQTRLKLGYDTDFREMCMLLATERKEVSIYDIKKLFEEHYNRSLERGDAVKYFKTVQDLGWGRFIAGRRGKKSRLRWHEGAAAEWEVLWREEPRARSTEGTLDEKNLNDVPFEPVTRHRREAHHHDGILGLSVAYKVEVRPGYTIEIEDLTAEEAERLAVLFGHLASKIKEDAKKKWAV